MANKEKKQDAQAIQNAQAVQTVGTGTAQALQVAYDVIYLTACGINGVVPEFKRLSKMDMEEVYDLSKSLSLTAITCMALESAYCGELPDEPVFQKWKDGKDFSLYRNILFKKETEEVEKYLRSNKVWYCPLKGVVIDELYPDPGMREMCDVDILFDKDFAHHLHVWFLERGYGVRGYDTGNADSYIKKPVYSFEMHRSLFNRSQSGFQSQERDWFNYYKDVKERLIPDPADRCKLHFSNEDFYVYLLAHMYKHYHGGGTGLRSLLDVYVYLKAKGGELDWKYVNGELLKLGIKDFGDRSRICAYKAFSDPENFAVSDDPVHSENRPDYSHSENLAVPEFTEDEREFLESFLFNGTYGTLENRIKNSMKALSPDEESPSTLTKFKYIRQRFFPNPEFAREYYPFFDHPWQYPIGYVYRIISRAVLNGKKVLQEFNLVGKM